MRRVEGRAEEVADEARRDGARAPCCKLSWGLRGIGRPCWRRRASRRWSAWYTCGRMAWLVALNWQKSTVCKYRA